MKVDKEHFVYYMACIKNQSDKIHKFSKAIEDLSDGYVLFDSNNLYLEALLDLLKITFNDQDDYIGWWLYEDVEKKVWLADGTEINLETPEALYDFLIKENEVAE